jgi:hypothetical protein
VKKQVARDLVTDPRDRTHIFSDRIGEMPEDRLRSASARGSPTCGRHVAASDHTQLLVFQTTVGGVYVRGRMLLELLEATVRSSD